MVIAHSSIDLARYPEAEQAYVKVLNLLPPEDESRVTIIDGLAAAIYKQGEQASQADDHRAAADHFLRVRQLAPESAIRAAAEYDAAAAFIKLEEWSLASSVLETFRAENVEHELNKEATKQLAFVYRENGQTERSAAEHERISAESTDPELGREALLIAAELYDEAAALPEAARVYEQYVISYPRPLDIALESRTRLAEIFKAEGNHTRYYQELAAIVSADRDGGEARTDRSRYLAAGAALVLAERAYLAFSALQLTQPFDTSLAEKQQRMDATLADFESLVAYEVAEVTAAATYYIAEIYLEFSASLLDSERPTGLTAAELADYELVIEEEAFPFEERAIDIHQKNFELLATGIFNPWVQKSLDQLANLMPGRFAKNEISSGYIGSIQTYAYTAPTVPQTGPDAGITPKRPMAEEFSQQEDAPASLVDADNSESL